MSYIYPVVTVPWRAAEAKRRIRAIIDNGFVTYSEPHAREEMAADGISTVDCENVLRGGVVDEPEWENGAWRYRVRTRKFVFIVQFLDEAELLVVTAWRQS